MHITNLNKKIKFYIENILCCNWKFIIIYYIIIYYMYACKKNHCESQSSTIANNPLARINFIRHVDAIAPRLLQIYCANNVHHEKSAKEKNRSKEE